MSTLFVTNEATCAGCGAPSASGQCTCKVQPARNTGPEPLGLPRPIFEDEPVVAVVNNRPNGGIGIPVMNFEREAEPAGHNQPKSVAHDARDDGTPTPLGLPRMEW